CLGGCKRPCRRMPTRKGPGRASPAQRLELFRGLLRGLTLVSVRHVLGRVLRFNELVQRRVARLLAARRAWENLLGVSMSDQPLGPAITEAVKWLHQIHRDCAAMLAALDLQLAERGWEPLKKSYVGSVMATMNQADHWLLDAAY